MDLATLLALVAAVAALGALVVVLRRLASGDAPAVREKFRAMIQPRAAAAAHESAEAMEYRLRRADGSYL